MKKIILTIIVSLIFNTAVAQENDGHDHDHEAHAVRLLKKINVGEGAYVYLSARDNGHVLGQPFVVETRVSCNGEIEDYTALEVVDSHSVCNMKPESVVINTKSTAVAMLAKSANINRYYEDIGEGVASPEITCHQTNEVLKFSLQNLCKTEE